MSRKTRHDNKKQRKLVIFFDKENKYIGREKQWFGQVQGLRRGIEMLWGEIRQVDIQGRSLKRRSSKRSRREQAQAKTRRWVIRREDEAINTAKHVWKSCEPEIRWTSASWNNKTQTTCSCTLEGARPTHNLRSLSSQEETNKKSTKC